MGVVATALDNAILKPSGPQIFLFISLENSFIMGTTLSYTLLYLQERFRGVFFLFGTARSFLVTNVSWAKILP